jgi:hypothetical protein
MNTASVTKAIAKLGFYALMCCDASQAFGMMFRTPYRIGQTSLLLASDERTYGAAPIKDVIDVEGAMASFFESREEWLPAFRSIAGHSMPEDTAALLASLGQDIVGVPGAIDFHEESSPWRRSHAIPQDEEERQVLAKFLDAMQESLLAIPVNEVANPETDPDDEDDLQFVEEGRRLLALGRFQVLRAIQGGSVESIDSLFAHCWSEVMELSQTGTAHTGSLILVPEYDFSDLRRFVDMNLVKPLEWLGVQSDFEVVSLQRDSPAIRVIYKLKAIPTGTYTEEEGFAASE